MKTSSQIQPTVFSQKVKRSKKFSRFKCTTNMAAVEMDISYILLLKVYLTNIFQDKSQKIVQF